MTWLKEISELLSNYEYIINENEECLTTPVGSGAVEVESDGWIYYRQWDRTHGLSEERELALIPVGMPLNEQACMIRVAAKEEETRQTEWVDREEREVLKICSRAIANSTEIPNAAAKVIASWYDDNSEGVHEFVTTGAITSDNLWRNIFSLHNGRNIYNSLSENNRIMADMLGTYLLHRRIGNNIGPIENWASLHLDKTALGRYLSLMLPIVELIIAAVIIILSRRIIENWLKERYNYTKWQALYVSFFAVLSVILITRIVLVVI